MRGKRRLQGLIGRHFSSLRKSQRSTLGDLSVGLLRSGRVGLASIARGMECATTVRHRIKRLWRFGRNDRLCLEKVSGALVGWIASGHQQVVVALDWTDLGDYVMLAAKVAVARRGVPIAWLVMAKGAFSAERKSRNQAEEELIGRVRRAMGSRSWVLVADRGFARADLIAKLTGWGVRFVIRACGGTWVEAKGYRGVLDGVRRNKGRVRRWGKVLYQKRRRVAVGLVVTHREPAPEPWYLVTNVEGAKQAVRLYRQRMWIEEAFRDAKSNLGLGRLWLARAERIERLMIVVAVAMLLAVMVGLKWRQRHGALDPQLSTKKRGGTLSVFRIGLELLRQQGMPPGLSRIRLLALAENTP